MKQTDGIIIRCPQCGALNVILKGYELYELRECIHCEGSIMPNDRILYKQSGELIP
jgi:hypothetical protein